MERERNEIGYKANSQYWCLTAGHSTGNVSMTSASSAIVLRAAVNPFLICKASHTWSKMGHHGHFAVKNAVLRWKICWLSTAIVTRFRAKKKINAIWIGHHFISYILIACTKRPLSMTGNDSMAKCMTGQHANDSMTAWHSVWHGTPPASTPEHGWCVGAALTPGLGCPAAGRLHSTSATAQLSSHRPPAQHSQYSYLTDTQYLALNSTN